jgi:hypothetical protein
MSEPAKIYLSEMPNGLAVACSGGLFGDDGNDPRRNLRQRLKMAASPAERSQLFTLSRKLGAAELSAMIKEQSAWTA